MKAGWRKLWDSKEKKTVFFRGQTFPVQYLSLVEFCLTVCLFFQMSLFLHNSDQLNFPFESWQNKTLLHRTFPSRATFPLLGDLETTRESARLCEESNRTKLVGFADNSTSAVNDVSETCMGENSGSIVKGLNLPSSWYHLRLYSGINVISLGCAVIFFFFFIW